MRESLAEASSQGNLPLVISCLENQGGHNVDSTNRLGQTALHLACAAGALDCVKYLLNNGADANKPTNAGTTPLHFSARQGSASCVDALLSHNANVSTHNIIGKSPLTLAAEKGHVDVVKRLLDANADVNDEDLRGRTSLHMAVEKRNVPLVQLLISRGASMILASDGEGDDLTPIDIAWRQGNTELAKMMEEWPRDDARRKREEDDENARQQRKRDVREMFLAAWAGDTNMVQALIKQGVPVNGRNTHGNTPLHEAVENGHVSCAAAILSKAGKAAVKQKDCKGNTCLHLAAASLQVACIGLLLENDANPNDTNVNGETPLHLLMQRQIVQPVAATRSLTRRPSVSLAPPLDGSLGTGTSLGSSNRWPSVGSLEQLDRSFVRRSSFGSSGSLDRLLSGSPANPDDRTVPTSSTSPSPVPSNPSLGTAGSVEDDIVQCVERLLNAGADPHLRDNKGQTPTMKAIENNHISALNWMLGVGENWEEQKKNCVKAINFAKAANNYDLADMLSMWLSSRLQTGSPDEALVPSTSLTPPPAAPQDSSLYGAEDSCPASVEVSFFAPHRHLSFPSSTLRNAFFLSSFICRNHLYRNLWGKAHQSKREL
mmetsp:Transcript_6775/g.11113  ORF Transcript_6775/g.11113 Transcript_6775/m.11113 type:complete len:602 (-) Transcript_6775:547-2352(-)